MIVLGALCGWCGEDLGVLGRAEYDRHTASCSMPATYDGLLPERPLVFYRRDREEPNE